jgi:FkbM family methyltransferase
MPAIFTFANGIRLFEADLLPAQIARYRTQAEPRHEPVEEAWFDRVLDEAPPGAFTFLDIGAALGYYAILVRRRRPDARIVAVDPNPDFHARFAETLTLNGLGAGDVELMRVAVAPRPGTVAFALNSYGAHLAPEVPLPKRRLWPFGRGAAMPPGVIAVEAIDLDALLARMGMQVDLAKLDIQGHELAVLEASTMLAEGRGPRTWIIGTHGVQIHAGVRALLARRHDILFEDQAPQDQPDGIIVARRHG